MGNKEWRTEQQEQQKMEKAGGKNRWKEKKTKNIIGAELQNWIKRIKTVMYSLYANFNSF